MTDQSRDHGFVAIVVLVACTAIWLLLMPFVPAVASATLHRFHLGTRSFALWAMQQPIPSMYNFSNRYVVLDEPTPPDAAVERRYINHFPSRIVTFADGRHTYLASGEDRWITIESSYRGQTIVTRFHARAKEDGVFDLIRLAEEFR